MSNKSKHILTVSALLTALAGFNSIAQAATVTWDGTNGSWNDATKWSSNPSLPTTEVDSISFASGSSSGAVFMNTTFTLGSGQTLNQGANTVFRMSGGDLTLANGSTFDLSSGGNGSFAENGTSGGNVTIEAGASATAWRVFTGENQTWKFVADASGVSSFDSTSLFFIQDSPTLEVDLSSYNIASGTDLVLFDYANLNNNDGGFGSIVLTEGWSGTINYTYDQGSGDMAVALTNIIPEPGTYALISGCLALTAVMLRRRQR